ncbi:hypothetical protein [Glaciecola sp. SC05]|uniref:hypothetical protein n=1 Tax=Glaciecola sp. SC05 TaxID=1987355 RepID=UPI00352795AD
MKSLDITSPIAKIVLNTTDWEAPPPVAKPDARMLISKLIFEVFKKKESKNLLNSGEKTSTIIEMDIKNPHQNTVFKIKTLNSYIVENKDIPQ